MVKCQICGKELELLSSHVAQRDDHPSWEDYKKRYPDSEYAVEEVKQRKYKSISGSKNPDKEKGC